MIRFVQCCLAFTLGSASVPSVAAAAVDHCPVLPADSGLVWQLSEGPDFSVCYATSAKQPAGGTIGVYLGFHPNFDPQSGQVLQSGTIEGTSITWYRKQPDSSAFAVGAETIHSLNPHVAYIWVLAPSQQELGKLIHAAEQLRFSRRREL
jgi:hypothetical protein